MTNNDGQNQGPGVWICYGKEKNQPHPPLMVNDGEECPRCFYVKKIKRRPVWLLIRGLVNRVTRIFVQF
jgi:hypothetical protein